MMYERLKAIIDETENIVCLTGSPLVVESGYSYIRDLDVAYEIEDRYGYAPEELFSAVMLSTRPELFFKYYRKEVLHEQMEPSATFYALARLEQQGKLKCIVTRSIYGLAKQAGCRNVIELRGSVVHNRCQKCGREYSADFIAGSRGIPQCESCASMVRPGIVLNGEMIDNGAMTRAVQAIQKADVLLVLGTTLVSDLAERLIQYYNGSKLVIVHEDAHYSDRIADYVVQARPMDVLPKII